MRLSTDSFRGMVPRLTPRALPEGAAQDATNARMVSGDLEAFRRPLLTQALENAGAVRTIHLMAGEFWLSWEEEVEVARGLIPGDTTYRTYITGLDVPRFTNLELATTGGSGPMPYVTRPLGVGAPQEAPELVVLPPAVTEGTIAIENPGAEVGTTAWTTDSGALVSYDEDDIPGLLPYAGTHFFGSTAVALTEAHQDIDLATNDVREGQTVEVVWRQASGAAGSQAQIRIDFVDSGDVVIDSVEAELAAAAPALTWQERRISGVVPPEAVTMSINMVFSRMGGGDNDAFIDAIVANGLQFATTYDGTTLSGWTTRNDDGGEVVIDPAQGQPAPCFKINPIGGNNDTFMWRPIGTDTSPASVVKVDVQTLNIGTIQPMATVDGAGYGVLLDDTGIRISYVRDALSTEDGTVQSLYAGDATGMWFTVTLTLTAKSPGFARAVVRVVNKQTSAVVVDDAVLDDWRIDGGALYLKANRNDTRFDNVNLQVDPPDPGSNETAVYTTYVFTYVNDLGDESAPSPVSEVVQRSLSSAVEVTTPTDVPTGYDDYGIELKRIYRAATGATGTAFLLVEEIPLATAVYTDQKSDAELGEVLPSELYDLPHPEMRGIIALPNGVMAGFFRNQLCLSVQNRPHAWPVGWRLTTDSDIVAIANVDTTIIIGTQTFVYTASGTDPSAYSMSKPGAPHACTSRRSMAYLIGMGVIFAGPDGYMLARGATQVENLTENVFTKDQWELLDPSSILTTVHDNTIMFFWDSGSLSGGQRLDLRERGAGLVAVGMHATAAYVDPKSDALYLVIDAYAEPEDELLPALSQPLDGMDGSTIYEWDADADLMVYRWRGRLNLLGYPMLLHWAQVKAGDFDALVHRVIADGVLIDHELIEDATEFRVTTDGIEPYSELEIELVGTSRARTLQIADDVEELT